LIVDGIDGPLARWADVRLKLPGINGATLDLVVDYLTYVFVPAIMIYRADFLPALVAPYAVAAILISSLYTFARTDMKTADNFFVGFPALWNVVVFYLFLLRLAPVPCAALVFLFSALTFAPVHFVHPIRVRSYQPWLAALTALWAASGLVLLLTDWNPPGVDAWQALSLACASALIAVGVARTLRGLQQHAISDEKKATSVTKAFQRFVRKWLRPDAPK
jgi:phosphatidylcholine synthase